MENKKLNLFIKVLIAFLCITLFFELFNNVMSVIILFLGGLFIIYPKKISNKRPNIITVLGIFLLVISLFSTVSAWVLLAIIIILFLNENQEFFNTIKDSFSFSPNLTKNSDFVTVRFDKVEEKVQQKRTSWFGNEGNESDIYEWEDINYTKVFGNTIIDLGNTIVPKEQNTVMIRNGVGDIKILIPEEIATSLDLSVFLGKITIDGEDFSMNNETIKWKSNQYNKKSRKIKIIANTLFGQVEVIFI